MKSFVALFCLVASAVAHPQFYYTVPRVATPYAAAPVVTIPGATGAAPSADTINFGKSTAKQALDAAQALLPASGPVVANTPFSPSIITQYGNVPIPATTGVTPDARAKLVPALKNLVAVLEKDVVDVNEVSELLAQSRDLFNEMAGMLEGFDLDF